MFAEKQPVKGVENYFTDALLYQEANKVAKEPLLEGNDSGNEPDSEPEEDTPATFALKPIVAYFNDPECNNPIENDDEWVINENVIFDYPVSVDLFKSANLVLALSKSLPLFFVSISLYFIPNFLQY